MDNKLDQRAASLIAVGTLPNDPAATSMGGSSAGGTCKLCTQPIRTGEPEIELSWERAGAPAQVSVLHPVCHHAWLVAVHQQVGGNYAERTSA